MLGCERHTLIKKWTYWWFGGLLAWCQTHSKYKCEKWPFTCPFLYFFSQTRSKGRTASFRHRCHHQVLMMPMPSSGLRRAVVLKACRPFFWPRLAEKKWRNWHVHYHFSLLWKANINWYCPGNLTLQIAPILYNSSGVPRRGAAGLEIFSSMEVGVPALKVQGHRFPSPPVKFLWD